MKLIHLGILVALALFCDKVTEKAEDMYEEEFVPEGDDDY